MSSNLNTFAAPGIENYHYGTAGASWPHAYLLPVLRSILERHAPRGCRVFEIGAGNGYIANELAGLGYSIAALEPSAEGVAIAQASYPQAGVFQASIYDDLDSYHGKYDFVYSLEVIEHLYAPRELVKQATALLKPGGHLTVSAPFHGYWKNLALALTNKLDDHFSALWDHGHIKFWSVATLSRLLQEGGFSEIEVAYAGRRYPFSKSMIVTARRGN